MGEILRPLAIIGQGIQRARQRDARHPQKSASPKGEPWEKKKQKKLAEHAAQRSYNLTTSIMENCDFQVPLRRLSDKIFNFFMVPLDQGRNVDIENGLIFENRSKIGLFLIPIFG